MGKNRRMGKIGKSLFLTGLAVLLLVGIHQAVAVEDTEVTISVFVREGCGHCRDAKVFLSQLQQEKPEVKVVYYDLAEPANTQLFNEVTTYYGLSKGTPLTLVGGQLIPGFGTAETSGEMIREAIAKKGSPQGLKFEDIVKGGATVGGLAAPDITCDELSGCSIDSSLVVTLPIIGTNIDVGTFSLASLSLVLGLVDGFNPCAMWVLVMFLVLLSQAGSKKRMWQFAGLFILAEAITYYLILMVWFAVWDFVALDRIVTPLVGLLALGSGFYFLYKFKTFKPVCSVTSLEQQQKVEERASALVSKPMTIAVAIGVVGLALSVNIFEFACSVGIPQAFTKILEINQLSWLGTQWFVALYIFMYMFDDLVVFGLALWSFNKINLTHKYSKWTTLIGGILMVLLGMLMLLRPEWLVM